MFFRYVLYFVFIVFSGSSTSADYYQSGKITNLTAVNKGLMIMMDKGLPSKCEGAPYVWMLIKQEHTALTSLILTLWTTRKNQGTVYVSGRENGTGYCIVSQFDPIG